MVPEKSAFISYRRTARRAVEILVNDLESIGWTVWFDKELATMGGQPWWDTILEEIRLCDLFIIALSYDWLKSKACQAEYEYARRLNKRILPIVVKAIDPNKLPENISPIQTIFYNRSDGKRINREQFKILEKSLISLWPPNPLPNPLPEPTPIPLVRQSPIAVLLERWSPRLAIAGLLAVVCLLLLFGLVLIGTLKDVLIKQTTLEYKLTYQNNETAIALQASKAATIYVIPTLTPTIFGTTTPGNTSPSATISPDPKTQTSLSPLAGVMAVPWVSVVDSGHFEAAGIASVLMLLKAYQVSKANTLADMQSYASLSITTSAQTLINLAKSVGPLTLTMAQNNGQSIPITQTLSGYITQKKPTIILVDYKKLAAKPFFNNPYLSPSAQVVGHWLVVIGKDGDQFVVNDALWKSSDNNGQGGFQLLLPSSALESAYANMILAPVNPLP